MRYADIIRANTEIDLLIERSPLDKELLEGIYDLILETVLCKSENIVIASDRYPAGFVKSKFLKLNAGHIVECQVKMNTFLEISRIELNTHFYP